MKDFTYKNSRLIRLATIIEREEERKLEAAEDIIIPCRCGACGTKLFISAAEDSGFFRYCPYCGQHISRQDGVMGLRANAAGYMI